ncbi:hypothetical protein WB514_003166 [Vibrio parahaemolyticus]
MSKEKGQRNRNLFIAWVDEMKAKNPPNWLDYWHGDTLSPKKIADELGFDSSAFKASRNKKLFELFDELKKELATEGVYQKRKENLPLEEQSAEVRGVFQDNIDESITDSIKVRDLKRFNARLQAENAKLTAEVARLSEFKEVLIEMGLWK